MPSSTLLLKKIVTFDTILRNQSNQLSSKFIILRVLCNILNQSSQAAISLTISLKECGRKKYMYG